MECLVTKLKGVIDDSSLMKLGELRIVIPYVDNSHIYYFNIYGDKEMKVSSLNGAVLTDSTGDNPQEQKLISKESNAIYVKNTTGKDAIISIENKYLLNYIILGGYKASQYRGITFVNGLDALNFSTKINTLNLQCTALTGDITPIIKKMSELEIIRLETTSLSVDLSVFEELHEITSILLGNINYYGKINIENIPNVISLGLERSDNNIFDDNSFFTLFSSRNFKQYTVSGSYSYNEKFNFSERQYGNAKEDFRFGVYNLNINDGMDNFLNDISEASFVGKTNSITIGGGTRTSASNTAITTLQSKNVTVAVPNATDANAISTMSVNDISEIYRIAYKNKELIVEPTTLQIYPASGVSVKEFNSIEDANAYIAENGLVRNY